MGEGNREGTPSFALQQRAFLDHMPIQIILQILFLSSLALESTSCYDLFTHERL